MITIKTGLPRNGKTASVVDELQQLLKRWEKNPGERRSVFQFGIPDLKLEGIETIVAWPVGGKVGDVVPLTPDGKPACKLAFDQGAIPDGALIVLDEAQDFYPPRGPSIVMPAHVSALNTHGHRNLDYIILTQHPKLIDNAVRRLVNKHQHYRRMLGGGRAVTYEWDVCSDSLEYQKAVKGVYKYPPRVFGLYQSATGFTRPKFKLPAFLIVPLLAVPLGIYAIPTAYRALAGSVTGQGISQTAAKTVGGAEVPRPAAVASGASGVGVVPVSPVPVAAAKVYSGCMSTATKCKCVTSDGTVEDAPGLCVESSREFGRLVKLAMNPGAPEGAPALPAARPSNSH